MALCTPFIRQPLICVGCRVPEDFRPLSVWSGESVYPSAANPLSLPPFFDAWSAPGVIITRIGEKSDAPIGQSWLTGQRADKQPLNTTRFWAT